MGRSAIDPDALEALARVVLGFGPAERISRQKLERKRIYLLIAWHPDRDARRFKVADKLVISIDTCYRALLPKAENIPES